ncbi:MAG TPA: TIM barrel protein, partial [Chloroflexota bacterium]|nr:TIM barrel protein [Chloroflexota bacterium]
DLCRPLSVEVVFHPHAGTYVEAPFEIDALMDATPVELVGLCLDTGHAAYGGADPVDLARRYAQRIRHVHAKDVRGDLLNRARQEGTDFITAVGQGIFAPLGEGIVDFPSIVATLQQAGYQGWYVLEQDIRLGPPWPEQDPLQNAKGSAAYLRQLLGIT